MNSPHGRNGQDQDNHVSSDIQQARHSVEEELIHTPPAGDAAVPEVCQRAAFRQPDDCLREDEQNQVNDGEVRHDAREARREYAPEQDQDRGPREGVRESGQPAERIEQFSAYDQLLGVVHHHGFYVTTGASMCDSHCRGRGV